MPLIAQTAGGAGAVVGQPRLSNRAQTSVVAEASMPVRQVTQRRVDRRGDGQRGTPVVGLAVPGQAVAVVTFTITVSRLLTGPSPWVTVCFSGTEQGSASMLAIVRSFTGYSA
jgi:hypothetical protein